MTAPIDEHGTPVPTGAKVGAKESNRHRKVIAIVIMAVWAVAFANPLQINAPSFSALAIAVSFFAPSVAAGILFKNWAFDSRGDVSSRYTRAFRVTVFFAFIIFLPVVPFLLQVWLIIGMSN